MANITITATAEQQKRIEDAMTSNYNYTDFKNAGETKTAFTKRMIIQYISQNVKSFERSQQAAVDLENYKEGYVEIGI
jgi:hypothetical protein